MRYLATGGGTLRELNQLRAPMTQIFEVFAQQQRELERYRQRYGPLPDSDDVNGDEHEVNGLSSTETTSGPKRLTAP